MRRISLRRLRASETVVGAGATGPRRRALELRFFEERARPECAEALGVKIGTFDVVLLRALRAFRREWTAAVGAAPEEV